MVLDEKALSDLFAHLVGFQKFFPEACLPSLEQSFYTEGTVVHVDERGNTQAFYHAGKNARHIPADEPDTDLSKVKERRNLLPLHLLASDNPRYGSIQRRLQGQCVPHKDNAPNLAGIARQELFARREQPGLNEQLQFAAVELR